MKTLDQEQYACVLAGFIAQADRMVDQEREHIYLTLLATTVQASTQSKSRVVFTLAISNLSLTIAQKSIVRRQFPTFVNKLTMIGVKRRSTEFIYKTLLFMADLIADIVSKSGCVCVQVCKSGMCINLSHASHRTWQ